MPRGDKTGPRGQGPRTGRGLGTCKPKKRRGNKMGFEKHSIERINFYKKLYKAIKEMKQ